MAEIMAAVRPRRLLLPAAAEADAAVLLAGAAALLTGAAALLVVGAAVLLAETAVLLVGAALTAVAVCLPAVLAEGVFVFKCFAFFPLFPNNSILSLLPGAFAFSFIPGRHGTHCNALS